MAIRKYRYQIILLDSHMRPVGRIEFEATSMDAAAKVYLREAKKHIGGYVSGLFLERMK